MVSKITSELGNKLKDKLADLYWCAALCFCEEWSLRRERTSFAADKVEFIVGMWKGQRLWNVVVRWKERDGTNEQRARKLFYLFCSFTTLTTNELIHISHSWLCARRRLNISLLVSLLKGNGTNECRNNFIWYYITYYGVHWSVCFELQSRIFNGYLLYNKDE